MKLKYKYLIVIILLISLYTGCSDDNLFESPPNLITTETLYNSLDGFNAGLNGLYNLVREERTGPDYLNDKLKADMFMTGTDNITSNLKAHFATVAVEWKERNNSEMLYIQEVWEWVYEIINSANTIINQAENRDDIDWSGGGASEIENKNRVLAEAKAIRAWAYRHLTFLFGDVPLNLEESLSTTIKLDWQRTPVAEVRSQMESDWLFAEEHLLVEPALDGQITKGAVQHYLAELYLVLKDPESALLWADKCINTPEYKLVTTRYGVKSNELGVPFMDMFYDGNVFRREGNTEALWVFPYEYGVEGGGSSCMRRWHSSRYDYIKIGGVNPLQLTLERGGRGVARMSFTKWALDIYESQDDRFSEYAVRKFYVLKDKDQNAPAAADKLPAGYSYGDTIWCSWVKDISFQNYNVFNWPFSRKFDRTIESDLAGAKQYNDQVYLRLAETYLLKAEAEYLLGFIDAAKTTINLIRERSNASPVTSEQVDLDFILDERSRELFFEEHRRYTLLRTGTWLERTRLHNNYGGQNITERDTIFPIPQSVIDANLITPMEQNPGYN